MVRFGQALAIDPASGPTNIAWNENGQVHTAYFNPDSGRWVDAQVIAAASSAQDLQLRPTAAILGLDGQVSSGLVATWTTGQGNAAETMMAVGTTSPFGSLTWSNPVAVISDAVVDEDGTLAVLPDGTAVVVSRKSDATDPAGDSDLHATQVTIDARTLSHDTARPAPSIFGVDLPANPWVPDAGQFFGRNFDLGLKFSNDKIPGTNKSMPFVGGKAVKLELDLRVRGGDQEAAPEYTGIEGYETATVLRGEVKLSFKLGDFFAAAGYLQGMFLFGATDDAPDSAPVEFIGGRLVVGLQGKFEKPIVGKIAGAGDAKFGAELGLIMDVRLQSNSKWRPPASGVDDGPVNDFASLVRRDGTPADRRQSRRHPVEDRPRRAGAAAAGKLDRGRCPGGRA